MSEEKDKDQEVQATMTVGEDWDWTAVQEVWERISTLHEFFRRQSTQIEWVSRGSLFAAMHAMLLECGGDISSAKANIIDLVQISFPYVAGQLASTMQAVWDAGELDGEDLSPPEKARLKSNLDMLNTCIEMGDMPMLDEEQLSALLNAQDRLSQAAEAVAEEFGQEATLNAICAMFTQASLFANGGDVRAAKAAALATMHQVWPVAINTVQKMVGGAIEQASEGPPEGRPN